ncbi:membrane lipoprotein lipid attachment site-containing protein [Aureitalea sp. L0-47]|uniref:hypothetical protein n=1 Tax=Aureitalea sp. L0-47 TaxID=2816962 RepID=UPI0022374D18|nr:hypothetical protein [Aureitalea sp. L0-47]MCW5518317.1 membrane lipoprotein lipid attachment site-containing protein [Aureitalea sp. L0-47]
MKKIAYLFLLTLIVAACNNSETKKTEDQTKIQDSLSTDTESDQNVVDVRMPVYRGEVIFTEEGAVMNGLDFTYGIVMDAVAEDLKAQVEPVKKDEYDMVKVVVTGVVSDNPALAEGKEGWEKVITIKKILSVSAQPSQPDVKIEAKN